MSLVPYRDLPYFEEFNEFAESDEFFESMASRSAPSLPEEDVFIVSHRVNRNTPPVSQNHYELAYVLGGRVLMHIDNHDLYLLDDSLCLMTPHSTHALEVLDPEAIIVNLCLRPSLFDQGVFADFLASDCAVAQTMRGESPQGYLVFSDQYGRVLHRSMRALLKEYRHAGYTASFSVLARVLLLLSQLVEIETYSFYGLDRTMMEILEYIGAHCAETSVASLAEHFGYSETYFSSLVRRRSGVRARELIVAARMRKAREMLAATDCPVQEIAMAVGYDSYSHFNRLFRQTHAITPAAWRAYARGELGHSG